LFSEVLLKLGTTNGPSGPFVVPDVLPVAYAVAATFGVKV
jgi:hypothetical protein